MPTVNNEQLESKTVLLRSRSYNSDTPSKRVQVDISSPNITENATNRDSTQQNTSEHIMSSNIPHNFSVKGKGEHSAIYNIIFKKIRKGDGSKIIKLVTYFCFHRRNSGQKHACFINIHD